MVYCKKDQKADIDIPREGKKMKNAPAYVKVYSRLKNEINKGTYPVGGFLPKECELEKIYQVSRTTVRNAVKMLVQEGLVEVRQGSGTRVLNHKAIQNYNKVTSVTESLMKKGYRVTTSDMMIDIISADKQLADELEIPEGTSVARIQRLQLADEEPVTLMENYIEYAKVPGIEAYENQFVALYQFLEEKFGLQIDETRDRISAKSATFMEAQVLKTEPKDALLVVHRVTYWQNRPVSIDHVRIIGSKYEVEISGKGQSK